LTVMIESFFGIHPFVVRSGQWKEMRPGEKDLYVYLMEQSERRCTRQLRVRDADIEVSFRQGCAVIDQSINRKWRSFSPVPGGNSRASTPQGWRRVLLYAAAVR
jgi:hypothetical protein